MTCEYKAKFPNAPPRLYNKTNLFGNQVKVPQQNNFTDCGVFLLQYVEQFFKDPVKDFRIPIKSLVNWFHQDIVTRKREEIAKLLQELIKRNTPEGIELPEIDFPTKDGKILEQPEDGSEMVENAFDDDEYVPTEEDIKEHQQTQQTQNGLKEETKRVLVPKKRSLDKNESSSSENSAKTPKLNNKNKS
jgi:sentrin-specific protease 7